MNVNNIHIKQPSNIVDMFEAQVNKYPNKTAVIAQDATLTYLELNEQANKIAHSLIKKGIGVGDIVAFALPKKSQIISTILGILKCGATYLPIEPKCPQDRLEYVLSDSKSKLFVSEKNFSELLNNEHINNFTVDIPDTNICYCIYTSGSTGMPKGVKITIDNLYKYISSLIEIYGCSHCMPFFTAEFVDLTVTSIWFPLLTGGKVYIYDDDIVEALFKVINNEEITIIKMTPTHLKIINKMSNGKIMNNVKYVILGGEQLVSMDLQIFVQKYGEHISIHNEYGPTETTVGCCDAEVIDIKDIHIGKPISNTQIYIVDNFMNIIPIGVTGELCIAGAGVGAGYLNRPELTAEKFIDNPFGKGKLYKTGDLAYWREDGNIAYVGRNDFQVKIRGLRIELGEIENAICSIDGISQAVVVVRKNIEDRQLICAFYTGAEVDVREIRSHIGKKLPKYMLPHICTHLDEMPLTSSGKVNRKALPQIDLENISNDTEYVAPKTPMQKELCKLIELVLGTTPVGVADDFFDMGGDSLKAIEFVSKAHNEGFYFNLQNVFDYPTVKELCKCIKDVDKEIVSFADVDFTEIGRILKKNKVEHITSPQKCDVGNLLLPGATGYLGIHILADYLDNDSGTAYCLVRGKNKADSINRLQEILNFYFGDKYSNMHRIEVVCADLQKDKFGLIDAEYKELLSKIDTVINCAASVKHYGTYKYFYEVNVESTKRLIDFCKESNAKLIHTSTLTVSGNGFDNELVEDKKRFSESDLYIGQPLENVYARSKFEAEKVLLDAMAEGLQANIMRMGNLTNRRVDGLFQKNYESNAFLKRIKAMLELRVYPDSLADFEIEFTPIDASANAIMRIVRNFSNDQTVFHISNTKNIKLEAMFKLFSAIGYEINGIPYEDFENHLLKVSQQEGMEYIFESFINDMDENNQLNYDSNIRIENDFTVQYLKQLGFEWSDIGIDYLRIYVNYFKKIGYFR